MPWYTKNGSLIRPRIKNFRKVTCEASFTKYCTWVASTVHARPIAAFSTAFEPWIVTFRFAKKSVPPFSIPLVDPPMEVLIQHLALLTLFLLEFVSLGNPLLRNLLLVGSKQSLSHQFLHKR